MSELVFYFSILVMLAVQLLLCFKGKRLLFRLLPGCLLGIGVVVCLVEGVTSTGWTSLGWMIFALLGGCLLIACGLGWGIWGVVRWRKRKESPSKSKG